MKMHRERETALFSVPEAEFEQYTLDCFQQALPEPSSVTFLANAEDQVAACATLLIQTHAPSYFNLRGKTGYIFNAVLNSYYFGHR